MGEMVIKEDLVVSNTIFVELSFLKYIELGKLIANSSMTEGTYTGILEIVKDSNFKARYTDDVEIVFKDVPGIYHITKLKDIQPHDAVLCVSPEFDGAARTIIDFIAESRHSKEVLDDQSQVTVIIGTSQLPKLSYRAKNFLLEFYTELFGVNVRIDPTPYKCMDKSITDTIDTYFISSLKNFNNSLIDNLNANKYINKRVMCSRLLPLAELANLGQNEVLINTIFGNIEAVMIAATQFSFVNPFGCITDSPSISAEGSNLSG